MSATAYGLRFSANLSTLFTPIRKYLPGPRPQSPTGIFGLGFTDAALIDRFGRARGALGRLKM